MRIVLGLLGMICTTLVHAEIYKYVDETGHVTYSNTPRPGAKPLNGAASRPAKAKTPSPSPYYFPRVDQATQQQRDSMRRQLLLNELQQEQRNLAAAQAAQRQPGVDAGKAAEAVRLHEKNIEMLNQELARFR